MTPALPPTASPCLGHDLPEHPHGIIVAHVLKVHIIHLGGARVRGSGRGGCPHLVPSPHSPYLQQHVARLDAAISGHSPALHDGTDVDAAVTPVIALPHDADAQEVMPLWRSSREQALPGPALPALPAPEASPMLSVTVMMFRDMVESVMLLKEEACRQAQ